MLLEIYVVPPIYPVAENNEAGIPLLAGVAIPSGSVVYFTSTGTYTFGDNVVVGLGPEINFNEAPEINFDDNAKAVVKVDRKDGEARLTASSSRGMRTSWRPTPASTAIT